MFGLSTCLYVQTTNIICGDYNSELPRSSPRNSVESGSDVNGGSTLITRVIR